MSVGAITVPMQEAASPPEWIMLIPAGELVSGYDGRAWTNPDPDAVVAASSASAARPMPVDWEHATMTRASNGQEAPAAGWIDALEVRDGAIWGHVAWTPRAADQVQRREYRFVSPVFDFERAAPNKITRLHNVGLTNTPNLPLTALNTFQSTSISREPTKAEIEVAQRFNMDPRRLAQHKES